MEPRRRLRSSGRLMSLAGLGSACAVSPTLARLCRIRRKTASGSRACRGHLDQSSLPLLTPSERSLYGCHVSPHPLKFESGPSGGPLRARGDGASRLSQRRPAIARRVFSRPRSIATRRLRLESRLMDQSEKPTFGVFLAHRRKRSPSASEFTIVHTAREGGSSSRPIDPVTGCGVQGVRYFRFRARAMSAEECGLLDTGRP